MYVYVFCVFFVSLFPVCHNAGVYLGKWSRQVCQTWRSSPSQWRMRTSAWLLQSSCWVLATEICPWLLWTSHWLAHSSSPMQTKMKTGMGEWRLLLPCKMSIFLCDRFVLFVIWFCVWVAHMGLSFLLSSSFRVAVICFCWKSLASERCEWKTGGNFMSCRWLFLISFGGNIKQTHSQLMLSQQIWLSRALRSIP